MRHKDTLTAEELLISGHLRTMRLSRMADAFEKQMLDPNADLSPFMDRFGRIVSEEWDARYNKKFNKLLRQAKLRYPAADLDETIYEPERLRTGSSSGYGSDRILKHLRMDRRRTEPSDIRKVQQWENVSCQRAFRRCASPVQDSPLYQGEPAHERAGTGTYKRRLHGERRSFFKVRPVGHR